MQSDQSKCPCTKYFKHSNININMNFLDTFRMLPTRVKTSMGLGLFLAITIALPLFVWTAINVNLNLNKRADEDPPNFCGGTCGSNVNCQANLYCYTKGGETQGFCRNPICSTDTDCTCDPETTKPTQSPTIGNTKQTSTPIMTPRPTTTTVPKGGSEDFGELTSKTPNPATSPITNDSNAAVVNTESELQNNFLIKYAMYIVGALALFVIIVIVSIFKKKRDASIPHITPPTNI